MNKTSTYREPRHIANTMLCCRFTFSFLSGAKEAWLAGSLAFASGLCVLAAKDNVPAKCVGLNLKQ
jgi:hypothetical protein